MALTAAQFQAWLENSTAIRCLLVEVIANIGGTETTIYLSNRNYNTGPTDTPANTNYLPIIKTSLNYTQSVPLDGSASLNYGDIAIDNTNGVRDSWLSYIWANRAINIYIGDVSAIRTDFTKIYSGYVADISSSDRNTLNISIRDVLQKLNSPISSALIGGTGQNSKQLKPLVFGEVHNITPVLFDAATLKYMVHNGPIERIIEVRDNGVPVTFTPLLTEGCFTLPKAPAGTITCSVQGERSAIDRTTGTVIAHTYGATENIGWTRLGTTATINHTAHGFTTGNTINIQASTVPTTIPLGTYSVTVSNANAYTITCSSPENLVTYSEQFDNAAWSKTNATVSANAVANPLDANITAELIYPTITSTSCSIFQATSVTGAQTRSIYAKASGKSWMWIIDTAGTNGAAWFNLTTGALGTVKAGYTASIVNVGNGWYRCSVSITSGSWSFMQIGISEADNSLAITAATTSGINIYGAQVELGLSANTYFANAATLGSQGGYVTVSSYANTVAELIQVIIQKYGVSPVTPSNINLTTFNAFDLVNKAPVGVYITNTTNVISVCQELATSLGAQFTATSDGLITLVQITSPSAGTLTITDDDILLGSVAIEQKVAVQGAIRLNYCKNWTVQTQLLTGIPEDHKTMLGLEYLNILLTDATAISTYSLSSEVSGKDTYLVSNSPITYVATETQRVLDIWKTPRFIYKMEVSAKFLTLKLGDMVNISHYRFGLSGPKPGQVVSISTNWDTGRTTLGVLV